MNKINTLSKGWFLQLQHTLAGYPNLHLVFNGVSVIAYGPIGEALENESNI